MFESGEYLSGYDWGRNSAGSQDDDDDDDDLDALDVRDYRPGWQGGSGGGGRQSSSPHELLVKVTDFGLSKDKELDTAKGTAMMTGCGSILWMAPEMLLGELMPLLCPRIMWRKPGSVGSTCACLLRPYVLPRISHTVGLGLGLVLVWLQARPTTKRSMSFPTPCA